MGRPSACLPDEKVRLVLEVLAGRMTLTQAAAEAGVSTTSIYNWKRQFLRAACEGLAAGRSSSSPVELAALEAENRRLAEQVRDATVLLRVWKMSARARSSSEVIDVVPNSMTRESRPRNNS